MQDSIKIASLELENVKRVRAVQIEPGPNGLTVIGGANRQGKTSILDAIAYGLGGEKYRPTNLQREGGAAEARIDITLSNGLRVTRSGKNASLKVVDPSGQKGGQKLLDSFVDELALNLPKFLQMSGKDKASVLLKILGIGDQLAALDNEERKVYEDRTIQGRISDQKQKFARELPEHHDLPDTPVAASELVAESQAVMRRNAERQAARGRIADSKSKLHIATERRAELSAMMAEIEHKIEMLKKDINDAEVPAPDESTAEIEARINDIENTNAKIRANLDKRKAIEDAEEHSRKYNELTAKVEEVRLRRKKLLDGAEMPLPGLSVDNGELVYDGKAWDCMSGVEKVRSAVAIVRKLKPQCGFVLLDQLEAFDIQELGLLSDWLEQEGLQAIATRVSTGDECSIVIEDGMVVGQKEAPEQPESKATQTGPDEDW